MEISMAFRHILLNCLILNVIIILSTAKFTKTDTEFNYNVSNNIHLNPLHYDIKIKYDVYRNILFGECNITMQVNRETQLIIIYSKIAIIKIDLIDNNDQTIRILQFSVINVTYIYLDFDQLPADFLSSDTYILRIIYVRIILDDEDLYESYDINKKKISKNKSIKVIKAGELFPYVNEPIFKSTFKMSIRHHKNYNVLSNMPLLSQVEDMDNMLWTYFHKSSLMSAKHLTIVITTFTDFFIPIKNVKIWYRKEIIDQLRFAENIVNRVIHYLKLKSQATLPKIDYFVIKDFEHSNVKIPGFILLREEDIIYDNILHDTRNIEVANLIARETISYWYDDVHLWSKQGFIMFLTTHILEKMRICYRMMDLFVVQTQQESLRFEKLLFKDSFSLHIVNNSLAIDHLFKSSLRYIKSSITWRMLYHILSEDTFWTTINTYINIHQTNAADTSNLSSIVSFWTIVKSAPGIRNKIRYFNINNVIWSTEKHCPELTVKQNYSINSILITYINYDRTLLPDIKQYQIYVTYTTQSVMNFETSDIQTDFWLSSLVPHYYIYEIDNNDWIILNLQQTGYYRVNYDSNNWQKLANHLYFVNYTDIHVLNRAQIIDDAFYFLTQLELNFIMFWDITSFLCKDTDYVAWYPMIKAVERMTCMWSIQDTLAVKQNINILFDKLLRKIGYYDKFNESNFTIYLREEAIKWACVLDVPGCRRTAAFELEKHLESSVQNKFFTRKEWIYCKGLMTANISTWYKVLYKYEATSDNTLLDYLTCSTNPTIIQTYLQIMRISDSFYNKMTNKKIKANNFFLLVAKHARNDVMLELILNHIKFFQFSLKKQIEQIAILIVIITHKHSIEQFKKISEFVKNNLPMNKEQLDAVSQKIEKRKLEYERKIILYAYIRTYS